MASVAYGVLIPLRDFCIHIYLIVFLFFSEARFFNRLIIKFVIVKTFLIIKKCRLIRKNPPFIRPLLNFKKIELEDYLKRNNQNWMNDPSNKNPKYLRNRVRLELMPLLEELTRDSLQSRLFALIDQSSTMRDWLDNNFQNWSKIVDKKKYIRKDILYVSDLFKVEKILQQEILYNFISGITGKSLSYRKLKKIFELIYKNSDYWEQHIFEQWEISQHGREIRLINRSKT